jgi:hypothetical protein
VLENERMSQPPLDPRTPVVAGVGQASERLGAQAYRQRSPVVRQFENSVPGARAPLGRSDNYPRSVAGRRGYGLNGMMSGHLAARGLAGALGSGAASPRPPAGRS